MKTALICGISGQDEYSDGMVEHDMHVGELLKLIDDLGLAPMTDAERRDLLEVVEERHGHASTIITSQLPIEHWHAWIGDVTIADAIMDRIMQTHHRITLTGESLRQKSKTSKQEKNTDPS